MSVTWTYEQLSRLRELGAEDKLLSMVFEDNAQRNQAFQKVEHCQAGQARQLLNQSFVGNQPLVDRLTEDLGRVLRERGMTQVLSPIIMSRSRIVKMGLKDDPIFSNQIFWLDDKRCLRPMLAPHLYEYMLDLVKIRSGAFGLFEIGPCFRKESQGARHANEFTMLNLVEVGLELDERQGHLEELVAVVMETAGISGWRLEYEDSTVYGRSLDVVSARGLELASSSMGPHPLDEAWGFTGTWVGLGVGLERLAMASLDTDQLSVVGRSLSRINGLTLKL